MSILSEFKKTRVDEKASAVVQSIKNGRIFIVTSSGKRLNAINESAQTLNIGDSVTVILGSPSTIVGTNNFKRGKVKLVNVP